MQMSASEWNTALERLVKDLSIPSKSTHIWKKECTFSFATAFSPNGLYVNMQTFQSFSDAFIGLDHDRTGNTLYLNQRFTATKEKLNTQNSGKKLEILVDEVVKVEKMYYLSIYPDTKVNQMLELTVVEGNNFSVSVSNGDIKCPEIILNIVSEIITRNDRTNETDIKNWSAEEEEENMRPVSKFALDMVQVTDPVQISSDPSTWRCEDSGMTENLWLNLHDGYIGSGRQNWDGSGGTGAALRHFKETGGIYPLCVKLGTITPEGKADIYSYDPSEDRMVKDPYLKEHLAHFGIDINTLKKTDKTLLELELDLNQKHIFSVITESEKALKPHYGPGFVGLKNLGNTCYMNSVIQVLFKLPAFQKRFLYGTSPEVRKARIQKFMSTRQEPQTDSEMQMIKLASALSDPESELNGNLKGQMGEGANDTDLSIPPKLMKDCFCGDHPEFKKQAQQDSEEFLDFFLTKLTDLDMEGTVTSKGLEKWLKKEDMNPSKWFKYVLEERLLCAQSQMVRYKQTTSSILSLNVPISLHELNKMIEANKAPGKGVFLPTVDFHDCLDATLGTSESAKSILTDYLSPATGSRGVAYQTSGMKTYPKYLCIHLRRYVISELDLTAHKLTCLIPVPLRLELSKYGSNGLQSGEVELPESIAENNGDNDYETKLAQLTSMGFSVNLCKHALLNNNNNPDLAVNWIFANSDNPVYALPPEEVSTPNKKPKPEGNLMQAEIEGIMNENNGEGIYQLRGFVSHMGTNTASGHYVCHVYDDELKQWVIFNDEKVAISEKPPLEHGYLYFYERLD